MKVFADEKTLEFRGALPSLNNIKSLVQDVSEDVLSSNLANMLSGLDKIIGESEANLTTLQIETVKASVVVDGNGEFSLLGAVTASAGLKATFEIELKRKKP